MEKLLNGDGIEMTGDLARALVASQEEFRKRLGDREAILLVSASTTRIRGDLVTTDNKSLLTLLLLSFRISYCNLVCLYILNISLGLAISCKTL
jgi:hypothetical protein